MAFQLGSIRAVLGLDNSDYVRGIVHAQTLNEAFGQSFTNFVNNPVLASIAAFKNFAASVITGGASILQTAQDLRRLSQETGISTDLLQAMEKTLAANGARAEQASQGLRKLIAQIGMARTEGGPAADVLSALGLSIGRLGENQESVEAVLQALASIEDPARRAALAAKLLGEEAGPVLANQVRAAGGSVQGLVADIQRLGQIIAPSSVDKLNLLKDALGRVEQNIDGITTQAFVAFLEGFIDGFDESTESVDRLATDIRTKLIPVMRELGESTGDAIENFQQIVDVLANARDVLIAVGGTVGYIATYGWGSSTLNGIALDLDAAADQALEDLRRRNFATPRERYEDSRRGSAR